MTDNAYLAKCGLLCDECPLFLATKANDAEAMAKLAVECSTPQCRFEPEDMRCEGCFSPGAEHSKMCGDCDMKHCAHGALPSCACCEEYPCAAVEERLPIESEYRQRLETMHAKQQKAPVFVHTMEYRGGNVQSEDALLPYNDAWYEAYRAIYNEGFRPLRTALGIEPIDSCPTREALLAGKTGIYLLVEDGALLGMVSLRGNMIDDLVVAQTHRKKGLGGRLLRFAVAQLQQMNGSPITLEVAAWNTAARKLYEKQGFAVVSTKRVR